MSNSKEVKIDVIKPFGYMIFRAKIPNNIVEKINLLCDSVISEKKRYWGSNLAGKIQNEWLVSDHMEDELKKFFCNIADAYIKNCQAQGRNFDPYGSNQGITSAWMNEMKKFEYNPVHCHTHCLLSSVLFLKVPDFESNPIIPPVPDKIFCDGYLEFINTSFFPGTGDAGNKLIKPEVGDFYIFPAGLQHTVYPFGCEGIRRSMAINFAQAENKATDS